jgi:hypothetical protein
VWTASAGAESPTLTGGRLSRRQSWNSSQGEAISLRDLGPVLVQDPDTPSPDDEHDIGLGVRNDFSTPVRRFHTAGSHSPTAYADSSGDEGDMQRLTPNGPDAARASPAGRRVYDGDGRARASPISLMARSPTVRRLSNTFHLASRSVSTYIGSDKGGAYGLMRTSDEAQPFSSSNDNVAVGITQSPSTPPSGMPPSPSAGLRGRTLGIFSARNPLRRAMDRLLRFS